MKKKTTRRSNKKDLEKQLIKKTKQKREPVSGVIDVSYLIPTGCTVLNLALSGHKEGGWHKGKFSNLIGDSATGKSIAGLTTFAEVSHNEAFDEYKLVLDDAEEANEFDLEYMFGEVTAQRVEAPDYTVDGEPVNSRYVEDFHFYLRSFLKGKKPCIYLLDSFDALDAEDDEELRNKNFNKRVKGQKQQGSYGTAKPKAASELFRDITTSLRKTKSFLLVISQTRDNIGAMLFAPKKKRSGGNALKFYACHEIWLAVVGSIKRNGEIIGHKVKAKITKNKLTGKKREVEFDVYDDLGIDNVGASVDYLLTKGHWQKAKKKDEDEESTTMRGRRKAKKEKDEEEEGTISKSANYIVPEFDFKGKRDAIIKHIEDNDLEKELDDIVEKKWMEIEESLKMKERKRRYA
jgi:RecA/RadA recombinase